MLPAPILSWMVGAVLVCWPKIGLAANFSQGDETASLFGTHEVILNGDDSSGNPFDSDCRVTFTPPVGDPVTVNCFYDGNGTWKARTYVSAVGTWQWLSASQSQGQLDGQAGSFQAVDSDLPGMLRPQPISPGMWMTDDETTFVHIADTAYRLFKGTDISDDYQQYVNEDMALGITGLRCLLLGEWDWDLYWDGGMAGPKERVNLANFQRTDERLRWMLDNHPGLFVQLILFPDGNMGDDTWSHGHSEAQRERMKRYIIARFAALPNFFWEVTNDTMVRSQQEDPDNWFLATDVGTYFAAHDPFGHLMAFGHRRDYEYPFAAQDWSSYIVGYTGYDISCDLLDWYGYRQSGKHVYNTEDYYETYHSPAHPRYFYRRLMWSYLLSGASATYAGRWDDIIPYSASGMTGLDDIIQIQNFLQDRHIDLALYEEADDYAEQVNAPGPEGNSGPSRPQCARMGQESFIVYVPNAQDGELTGISIQYGTTEEASRRDASLDANKTPQLRVDLTRTGQTTFSVEWFRPTDGASQSGATIQGGDWRTLTSPWQGSDAVLLLTDQATGQPPTVSIEAPADGSRFDMGQIVSVEVSASDPDGQVTAVRLELDGNELSHVERIAPYTWRMAGLAEGTHSLTAMAIDDRGQQAASTQVSFIVGQGQLTDGGIHPGDGAAHDGGTMTTDGGPGGDGQPGLGDGAPGGDGAASGMDHVSGGCACSTNGGDRNSPHRLPSWPVLLGLALLMLRRRRS